jgi:predicted SAM-dependent methyltransferase
LKLYIGSHDFRPDGYLTVDLDPNHKPDFVADAADLSIIPSESFDEVCASAILEHIAWPNGYKALSEWARVLKPGGVLKVSVPDMRMLCALVAQGDNPAHCIGMIYGTGRMHHPLEAHQYGYTRETLSEMLTVLGFADIDTWESDISDASRGWMYLANGEQVAFMLSMVATKVGPPLVDTDRLLPFLDVNNLSPFMAMVREVASEIALPVQEPSIAAITQQRLLFKLLDARQRIKYLEDQQEDRQ